MMKIILLDSMYRHSTNSQMPSSQKESEDAWMHDFIERRISESPNKKPSYIKHLDADGIRDEYHEYMMGICDMYNMSEEDMYFLMKKIQTVSSQENREYIAKRIQMLCRYALWQILHLNQPFYYYPGHDSRLDILRNRNRRLNRLFDALSYIAKERECQKKHYDDCD